MLQRSVTSVSDDKPPASPTAHRRNSRQYSLPVALTNPDLPRVVPISIQTRGIPLKGQAIAIATSPHSDKDHRHTRIPAHRRGPHSSTDSDDEYSRSRRQMFPQSPKRHVTSYSLYLPDSCSGLKDQFLRIKERFTKPVVEQPGTSSRSDVTATTTTGPATSSPTSSASPEKPKTNSWRGMDPHDRRRVTADSGGWIDPRDLLDPTRNEEIAMNPMELMHELTKLNASAQKLFADDPWSHGAERWVLEESHLRGVHPDISLQWIGRQLYGLTIQLPLARKELSMEHVSGMTTSTTPLLPSAEASAMASGGAVLPPRTTESFASNQPLPATPRSSTSPGHHVRSLSSDSAPTTMANPGSSMASATKATLLVRSMSTDLGAVMAGTMQLPPSMLNDTKWKQQQRKLLVSGMAERRAAAVGPMPPSTASSSTKTYHALAAPTTTTTLFEDDPFQRCDGIPRGAIVLDKVHCVKDDDYSDMPSSLTIAPSFVGSCFERCSPADYGTFSRRSCTLRVGDGESDVELNGWINAICRASFHCYLALPPSPQGKVNQMQAKRSDNEMYKYSSFQYLRETDPLLWEINPLDQTAIRKKAAAAASAPDYAVLFTKYAHVLKHIVLPRPRPISIEQTLRDIIPELFLINNILYGGGDTESIDDIFEVLEGYVRRFAASHDECVHIVSAILQACARTIAGGDSYFVVRTLLGSSSMVIRPAHNHGMPIVIDISSAKPTMFTITLQSAFMFHTVDEIERMDEADEVAPTCRVQTLHVQEIDFETSKSTRHLKIRQVLPDEGEPLDRNSHSSRSVNHDYGALLDGLG
ncbi:hypothetical protein DYB38_006274 [Aphanomyces astaci]|uniref:Uncharacterized protein n=1 Tax=Aphanomyces astaci TaxID=112090 RepID=A0A397CF53_APHAT|nr:hypothetical protein DYB38_006274 [Aphanomyces astaci]